MTKRLRRHAAACLIAAAGLCFVGAPSASAHINDFVGNWTNADRDTSGITRVEVTRAGARLNIRVFGQCTPRDCDWGAVRANIYADSVGGNLVNDAAVISGTFNAGFAEKFVVLREVRNDMLAYEVYTNFTDRSGRSDYYMRGRLRQARGSGGPGIPGFPGIPGVPGGPGRDGITLYEHVNYAGAARNYDSDVPNLASVRFNDVASSVRISDGTWELCEHANYAGRCVTLDRDTASFVPLGLNDRVSSLRRLRPGRPAPGGGGRPGSLAEDCIGFDPAAVQMRRVSGSWKIVEGSHWIADFGGNRAEAERALQIIRAYGFDKQCFVGRPDPSMTYWKRGNGVPSDAIAGQDCISFNTSAVEVRNVSGRWKIVEGSHWIADFGGNRSEAETALDVIQRYDLDRQCFVGRPDPSMSYWLASH